MPTFFNTSQVLGKVSIFLSSQSGTDDKFSFQKVSLKSVIGKPNYTVGKH